MNYSVILLLAVTLTACTYHSQTTEPVIPATYQQTSLRPPESVGHLRRLILLPVEIIPYEGQFSSPQEQDSAALSYENACTRFLSHDKGYEVLQLRESDGRWRDAATKELYRQWDKTPKGTETTSTAQAIGAMLNADGVLLIRVKLQKPWGFGKGILNIALMNIPLFYSIAAPNIGAWIYEAASGRIVWQEEHSIGLEENTEVVPALLNLFADLENAVPHQLIK